MSIILHFKLTSLTLETKDCKTTVFKSNFFKSLMLSMYLSCVHKTIHSSYCFVKINLAPNLHQNWLILASTWHDVVVSFNEFL